MKTDYDRKRDEAEADEIDLLKRAEQKYVAFWRALEEKYIKLKPGRDPESPNYSWLFRKENGVEMIRNLRATGGTHMDEKDLNNRFTYHAPQGNQADRYTEIRKRAKDLAEFLNGNVPEGREKSLAITKLEECVFWSNAAIARNE